MGNAVCPPRENDELDQFNGDDELDMRKMNDFSKPSINDKFPNLVGSTQDTDDFDLNEHLNGSWGMIFMHPGNFTPVCTTELGAVAANMKEFEKRGVKVVGFSCNDASDHRKWIKDIKVATGHQVTFPLFCDPDRYHATWLGIIDKKNRHADGLPLTVRSVYFIDPKKQIKFVITYPASTGRNMAEILRAIDSILLHETHDVATPVDWKKNEKVIVDLSLNDAEAKEKFGYKAIETVALPSEKGKDLEQHYLRYVKDPSA